MKSDLFRKEAMEKMTGPEDLNTYVKVLKPRVWLILLSIAIAVVGLVLFIASTGFPIGELLFGNISG